MTEAELIERMARDLAVRHKHPAAAMSATVIAATVFAKDAKIALAAIREAGFSLALIAPTDDMLEAAWDAVGSADITGDVRLAQAYDAMVKASLMRDSPARGIGYRDGVRRGS